jgi:DNA-binding transcriptional ArsR family regulator
MQFQCIIVLTAACEMKMTHQPPEISLDSHPVRFHWSNGTAYDLFASLMVLHDPERFGVRPSWAAGVRSRLSIPQRQVLEICSTAIGLPVHWLYTLPAPLDSEIAIEYLQQIPIPRRLPLLGSMPRFSSEHIGFLNSIHQRKTWDKNDLESLKDIYQKSHLDLPRSAILENILTVWAQADELGEAFLDALQAYYQVFFIDEEQRIKPALKAGIQHARQLALEKPLSELLENLTQGIRFRELDDVEEITLVPSFWLSPLIILSQVKPGHRVLVFGARPPDVSLVPGDIVPEMLLRGLKTIADPTRLRILRYLVEQPRTPTELASLLRLRAPTVTHHLSALRLAGLVRLIIGGQDDRRYAARPEAIAHLSVSLEAFLNSASNEDQE